MSGNTFRDNPELAAELHPTKNVGLTHRGKPIDVLDLKVGTNKKLDWKCSTCSHEWKAAGSSRVQGIGCPACANKVIHIDGRNSMANTHPNLAKEYQGDATKVIATTRTKLEWKCICCKNIWKSRGSHRVNGVGCPTCATSGYDPSKIGYLYIHLYDNAKEYWYKCGITNCPEDRYKRLSRVADKVGIEVTQYDIFTFDDGYIAQICETELLSQSEIRFESEYDIEGKAEFFKHDALDQIMRIISKYE